MTPEKMPQYSNRAKKRIGNDSISLTLLKQLRISVLLVHLINMSQEKDTLPKAMNIRTVISVYKPNKRNHLSLISAIKYIQSNRESDCTRFSET